MKYLLDTHAVVWLIASEEKRLPKEICESIYYCEDHFFVSEVSLIEIIQLQQRNRIKLSNRPSSTRSTIEENNIKIIPLASDILEKFYDLPIPTINREPHSDPFDRIIIATALRKSMTVISADLKFPWYHQNCGLSLYEI